MRKNSKKKKNQLSLRTLVICLFICNLLLTRVTFAKYITTTSDADSARVAKFCVTADVKEFSETFTIELDPVSNADPFVLEVENDSETAVRLTAVIEIEGNLPLRVTCEKEQVGKNEKVDVVENSSFSSFTNVLDMHQKERYRIYVKWNEITDYEMYFYSNGVSAVSLTVSAEQVD